MKMEKLVAKKLEHPYFLTFEQMLYNPNRKQITMNERRLLCREGLDLPPEGKAVIDGDIVVVSGLDSKVPIGFEWVLPEHLVDRARDEFGIIPQLPAEYRRRLGWEEQDARFGYYFGGPEDKNIATYKADSPERKMCELMVSGYPDDFYMYENFLILLKWFHRQYRFGNEASLKSHCGQFDDDLNDKIFYYYTECLGSRLQEVPYPEVKKQKGKRKKLKKKAEGKEVGFGSLELFMK